MNEQTYKSGDEIAVQLAPFGTFTCHDGNPDHKDMTEVVDREAVDAMVAAFDKELLVDLDHKSMDGTDTEAAAWLTKVWRDDEKGLMGTFRLTAKGAELIGDKRYRYLSPVWYLDENQKAVKLDSVALTNTPNLPVAALANAAKVQDRRFAIANPLHFSPSVANSKADGSGSDASDGVLAASCAVDENAARNDDFENENKPNERSPEMDELKAVLGLAAEATDAEIVDAVKALKAKNDELEAAKADAEAEQFAAENEDKGFERETLKNAYLASPEIVGKLLANMKAPAKPTPPAPAPAPSAPVCVAANATVPDIKPVKNGYAKGNTPEERAANLLANSNK